MDPIQISHLKRIQEASQTDRLVLFVGAGVSNNSGVPTWKELINEMKKELPNSIFDETDDLKVAQVYKDVRGEKEYLDKVKEILLYNKVVPNPIHEAILSLNPVHIITTNYDDLLEQETKNEFKQFDVIREDKDLPKMKYSSAIIKMHGDFLKENIVLTETDYYNYPEKFSLIRSFVQAIFANKLVVFIGFSFNDLNLKMILNDIKNILGEKMQRAYLISLSKPDQVTLKYFEQRFINIVHLADNYLDLILKDIRVDSYENNKLTKLPLLGQKLYKYLALIDRGDFNHAGNPISYAWNKLKPYQDEMRVYGRGLKYFLPTYMGEFGWYEHSEGVQTFHPYFEEKFKEIKERSGLIEFIKEIGKNNIEPLLKLAYYNSIFTLDRLEILNDKAKIQLNNYELDDTEILFNTFDYNGLTKRLKVLSTKEVSGNIEDLETGYIYYKIGNYYKAYEEFNKILPIVWKKEKYILYFIILYNLVKLRPLIQFQLLGSKTIESQVIIHKIDQINLSEVLLKIQIPKEFRKILQDLLGDKYLNEHLVETEKLKEEIHRQRVSAEHGAVSMNSNIIRLIGINEREDKFNSGNYILRDYNASFQALKRNVVIGILNSHATKNGKVSKLGFSNTKIKSLDNYLISILIFSLKFEDLEKIFKQYKIENITFNQAGVEYLRKILLNLKGNSFERFWGNFIGECITNFLYILSFVKIDDIDSETLYNLIIWLLDIPYISNHLSKFLHNIIYNYPPNTETAIGILKQIIQHDYLDNSFSTLILYLTKIIKDNNSKIEILDSLKSKSPVNNVVRYLGQVISEKEKGLYLKWAIEKLKKDFIQYVIFLDTYKLIPDNPEEFIKDLNRYSSEFECNYGTLGRILAEWRNNEKYSMLKEGIDESANSHPYLEFALNPEKYKDKENVKFDWLFSLGNEQVKKLLKDPIYNKIFIEHIATENYSSEERLELLSVYQYDKS